MSAKFFTKQLVMLVTLFMMSLFSSCNPQKATDNKKDDFVNFEVKIINMLPVGWGVKYKATIEKTVEGSTKDFNDSIIFGIIAPKVYDNINIGDVCILTLKNSREFSKTSYLPAITGTVSKLNEIWLITEIVKSTKVGKSRILPPAGV